MAIRGPKQNLNERPMKTNLILQSFIISVCSFTPLELNDFFLRINSDTIKLFRTLSLFTLRNLSPLKIWVPKQILTLNDQQNMLNRYRGCHFVYYRSLKSAFIQKQVKRNFLPFFFFLLSELFHQAFKNLFQRCPV